MMSPDVITGGHLADQDRYQPVGYRHAIGPADSDRRDDADYHRARLPSLELEEPSEPDFGSDWLEAPGGSMAEHPLLRGLMMELPPRGQAPAPEWLERWFEATRSILELLYGTAHPR
jgi:hypothetical protein